MTLRLGFLKLICTGCVNMTPPSPTRTTLLLEEELTQYILIYWYVLYIGIYLVQFLSNLSKIIPSPKKPADII